MVELQERKCCATYFVVYANFERNVANCVCTVKDTTLKKFCGWGQLESIFYSADNMDIYYYRCNTSDEVVGTTFKGLAQFKECPAEKIWENCIRRAGELKIMILRTSHKMQWKLTKNFELERSIARCVWYACGSGHISLWASLLKKKDCKLCDVLP